MMKDVRGMLREERSPPPRPKTKGAVLCGSAPLNGCGFGGGAAKRRPRFLASLPWFRTTGLLACPRPPPSLPGGFPSSGPMGSSGLQWRVRAGFSPASRASCGESPSGFRPDIMTFRRSLSRKEVCQERSLPTPAAPRGSPGPCRRRPRAPERWPTRRRRSPPNAPVSRALPDASPRDG